METGVKIVEMAPSEATGRSLRIEYRFEPALFDGDVSLGEILVARTEKGLCALFFVDDRDKSLAELEKMFPHAEFAYLNDDVNAYRNRYAFTYAGVLHLRGTEFQLKVWCALLEIPYGETITYSAIATKIGHPRAWRAVGSAVGANPVSIVVPCHRVLPASGGVGNYRWNAYRKTALLNAEKSNKKSDKK